METEKFKEWCEKFDPIDQDAFAKITRCFIEMDIGFQNKLTHAAHTAPGTISRWANGHSAPPPVARAVIVKMILEMLKNISIS